jgi:hypothetical protein
LRAGAMSPPTRLKPPALSAGEGIPHGLRHLSGLPPVCIADTLDQRWRPWI